MIILAGWFVILCRKMEKLENKGFKAIDFFCGGDGMTCGLRQAGIDELLWNHINLI
jgi:hypothetical protein